MNQQKKILHHEYLYHIYNVIVTLCEVIVLTSINVINTLLILYYIPACIL